MRKECDPRESEKAARLIIEGTKTFKKINTSLPKITENMFQHILSCRINEMNF